MPVEVLGKGPKMMRCVKEEDGGRREEGKERVGSTEAYTDGRRDVERRSQRKGGMEGAGRARRNGRTYLGCLVVREILPRKCNGLLLRQNVAILEGDKRAGYLKSEKIRRRKVRE